MAAPTPISKLGQGYSSFLGSALPTIIKYTAEDGVAAGIKTLIKVCTTTDDLMEFLDIDTSVGVSSSWGSFSNRLQFTHDITKHTRTVNIVVVASRETKLTTISEPPTFTKSYDHAADLYNEGGDGFVNTITWGGQYLAAYSFVANSDSDYQKLVDSANTAISSGATNFTASVTASIENIHSQTSVNYSFQQTGSGFDKGKMPDQDHLTDFVLGFGDHALDGPDGNGEVIRFTTQSYRHVAGCPRDFKQVETYRNDYLGGVAKLSGYAAVVAAATQAQSAVSNVRDIYDRYGVLHAVDPTLEARPAILQKIIDSVNKWRQDVDDDPTSNTIAAPTYDLNNVQTPVAIYTISRGQFCGNQGGDGFYDPSDDWITRQIKMSRITFKGGEDGCVNKIERTYAEPPPSSVTISPNDVGWGGGQRSDNELGLDVRTRITRIQVNWGEYVNWVLIETTQGDPLKPDSTMTFCSFNGNGGGWGTTLIPPDTAFLGWAGNAGRYLDAIQPVLVRFSPVVWKDGLTVHQ